MKQFIHKKPVNLITRDSFDDSEGSYFDTFNKEQSDYKEYYDKVEGPAKDYYNRLSSINDIISGLDEFQKNPNSMQYDEAVEKLEEWKKILTDKSFWLLITGSLRYLASLYKMVNDDDPVVAPLEITKQKRESRNKMPKTFTELEFFADDVRGLLVFLGEAMRWLKGLAVTDKELFRQILNMYDGDLTWITVKGIPGDMRRFIHYLVGIFKYVNEALPPTSNVYDSNGVCNWVDRAFKHIDAIRVNAGNSWNNGYAYGGLIRYKDQFLKSFFEQFGDTSWLDWLAEPLKKKKMNESEVMNFMDGDFEEDGNYFDSFSKDDAEWYNDNIRKNIIDPGLNYCRTIYERLAYANNLMLDDPFWSRFGGKSASADDYRPYIRSIKKWIDENVKKYGCDALNLSKDFYDYLYWWYSKADSMYSRGLSVKDWEDMIKVFHKIIAFRIILPMNDQAASEELWRIEAMNGNRNRLENRARMYTEKRIKKLLLDIYDPNWNK